MRDGVRAEYEKKVAAILNETGHPLRNDVMEELRAHLDELFSVEDPPDTLDELEELLGSPEEYADNLAPDRGRRTRPLHRRPLLWAVVISLALLFVATSAASIYRYEIAAAARQALGTNFYATPFFDMERMRQLQPGDSAEKIRDAIGYPLKRQLTSEGEILWEYTAPRTGHSPYYTYAQLYTDAETKTLKRIEIRDGEATDLTSGIRPRFPVHARGALWFGREGGQSIRLSQSSDETYTICFWSLIDSASELDQAEIEKREAIATEPWIDVSRESIRFIHIVWPTDEFARELNELLTRLPFDSPLYNQMSMPWVFENRGFVEGRVLCDVMVYNDGTLYQYPGTPLGNSIQNQPRIDELDRDDRNWLMHKLLED